MDFGDLFYFEPLIDLLLTYLGLACVAQVSYFSLLRVASMAEVVEEDIDDEVVGKILSIVLSNVFWTEFHLAGLDVISSLYERCVEHDSEHCLVGKACMLEDDLDVSAYDAAVLLLLCEEEDYTAFFGRVLLGGWVGKDLLDV